MAQLSYRKRSPAGIRAGMRRDERGRIVREDTAAGGRRVPRPRSGVRRIRPRRVRTRRFRELANPRRGDGAAMTGLESRVAEIMFSDFLAWLLGYVRERDRQDTLHERRADHDSACHPPRQTARSRFAPSTRRAWKTGRWHPGLKVVAPSTPADAKGLLAAGDNAISDPVVFFEHKRPAREQGRGSRRRARSSRWGRPRCCAQAGTPPWIALAAMVPRALKAAETLAGGARNFRDGDRRALARFRSIRDAARPNRRAPGASHRRENPRLWGWGAEIASVIQEGKFRRAQGAIRPDHDAPTFRARRRPARGRGGAHGRAHRRGSPARL